MPDVLALCEPIADHVNAVSPAFVCSRTDDGLGAASVHVAGELDLATAPQLEQTLRESHLHAPLVVLDLRDLEFMDCSGVRAIVGASVRARQAGRRLVLLRGPPNVDRMFALTGSSDLVEIGDLDSVEPPLQLAEQELAS